nr:glycosyltransferase family 1 protein [Planctomycetota bacterium]
MRVVQVIPQLPPAVNGLGDYARRLGGALAGLGFEETYLVTDAAWRPGADSPSPVAVLPRRDAAAFLAAVAELVGEGGGATGMILHWVNYAYQKRGCPYWLVGALAQLRTRHPQLRLVTMFHELYADSPPWGSPFWLRGIQQRLAVRAAGLSHACATNTIHHHDCLARWTGRGAEIPRLPVFSNIGDPEEVPSFLAREPELVVFGGPGGRSRAYRSPFLATACRALGVTAIHDIGPRPQDMPERLAGVPVHRH